MGVSAPRHAPFSPSPNEKPQCGLLSDRVLWDSWRIRPRIVTVISGIRCAARRQPLGRLTQPTRYERLGRDTYRNLLELKMAKSRRVRASPQSELLVGKDGSVIR